MANDMELELSFTYSKEELMAMIGQMQKIIENADLDPNITGNTKQELKEFQKEIKNFVKQTVKDFDKINGINLDSKAFDQYVKITDKRLDNLEGTVTQVIDTLKGIDSSTDLSGIGKAFDNLKEKVLANNTAIKEMVDSATELGAKVKIDIANENELDNIIIKNKEILESFENEYKTSVKTKSGYDNLLKSLKEVNDEVNNLSKQRDAISDKKGLEYLRIDTQRNELLAKRFELATKVQEVEINSYDFIENESKLAEQIVNKVSNTTNRIKKEIEELEDFNKSQKKGYSVAYSNELDGAKGDIPIRTSLKIVTTSQEMFEAIQTKLAQVQKKLNEKSLIVPVKYSLGTSKTNSDNPFSISDNEVKEAQKNLKKTEEEVSLKFDKVYTQIEKRAISNATKAAKQSISSVQEEMNKNPVEIKFDIPKSETERISKLLASNFLNAKINISSVLEEATSNAKELLELMKKVYETANQDTTGSYLQRIREETKKLTQAEEREATKAPKKSKAQITKEAKDEADELRNQIQDVFNKNKVKIKLELDKSQLDVIEGKIKSANLDKSLDITGSLKEAVEASKNIAKNLNGIKETNIKITSGRASTKDISEVKEQTQTLLSSTLQLDKKLNDLQKSIKAIGENDSGIKDLTSDFDRIISKIDEMISASKILVEDLRADISTIDSSFKELGNTIENTLDKKTFGDAIEQSIEEFKVGMNSLIKMLLEVINAIDKVKYSVRDIDVEVLQSQWKSLGEIDNEAIKNTVLLLQELDTTLSSIIESLNGINGLEKLTNLFKTLEIKDEKLEKINRIPDALNSIYEKVKALNDVPTSDFINQIAEISKQGESLKALASILQNSEKKIKAAMDIATGNDKNKKELDQQIKKFEKLETLFSKKSKGNDFSTEKIGVLKELEDYLEKINTFRELDIVSTDDIENAKQLYTVIDSLFDKLTQVEKKEKEATNELSKEIREQINLTRSYEKEFSRSWGYGTIPEHYGNEYSVTLSKIRQQLDEVKKLENQPPSKENLDNIRKINEGIEQLYTELKNIDAIAKPTKITNMTNKIAQYLQKNPNLSMAQYAKAVEQLNKLKPGITAKELNEIATAFNNIQYSAKMAGREGSNFLDAIRNKLKYGWAQSIAMFFSFYDIVRYIHEISSTVTELNSSLVELAKVSDASIGELYKNFSDFRDIAKETGGTINDIINATADWARNGYNLAESKELAKLSSIFQNIGDGLSADQSNEYLVSILKGFNLEASQAIEIMDKINNVSNNAASSVSNIGEALERSSSAFGAANTNLSEAVALLTTSNEVLQNPETVGTAFKSMSARLRSSTTELEEMGEETTLTTSKLRALVQALTGVDIQEDENTFKSIYDILLEIGQEWDNLTDVEQASLSEALFGKRNSQVGFSILNNVERLQEIYALAEDSAGSAMEEQQKYLDSVQYSIDVFQASVENLANRFMSSDFLKNAIDTGTKFIDILDAILDRLGTIPTLIGVIGTAISSKHNIFGSVFEMNKYQNTKSLPWIQSMGAGDVANMGNMRSVKMLIDEYNTSFSNVDRITKNTKLTHEQFIAEIEDGQPVLAQYLKTLGPDSAATFGDYRKQLVATTLKTTGLKIVTGLLQGAIMALVGVIVTKAYEAFDGWIHRTERAIEAGEEARQEIKSISNEYENQQKVVQKNSERFAELSQGVDQLSGKNISLSDDDYKEFLDISNELVDVMPTLTHHYDENGNAIISLTGNVDEIVGSLNNLLDTERELAKVNIRQNLDSAIEGVLANQSKYELFGSDISEWDNNGITAGIKLMARLSNKDENMVDQRIAELQQEKDFYYKEFVPYINSWLSLDEEFLSKSDEVQASLQNIISNIDLSKMDFESSYEFLNYIQQLTNDETLNKQLEFAIDVKTRFNNNEITFSEYEEEMQSFLDYVQNDAKDSLQEPILLSLGLDVDDENKLVNNYAENLRKKFSEEHIPTAIYDEILENFTKQELESLYDLDIDWREVLGVDEYKNSIEEMKKYQQQGNVDLFKRPSVTGSVMRKAGWDVENDSTATVFSSAYDITDSENNKVIVHVTPILPDGTVLSPEELEDYVYNSLEGANDVLKADSQGIVLKVDTDLPLDEFGNVLDSAWQEAEDWDIRLHELQESYYLNGQISAEEAVENLEEYIDKLNSIPFDINFNAEAIAKTTEGVQELQSVYQSLFDAMSEGKEGSDLSATFTDLLALKDNLKDVNGEVVDLGTTWDKFFDTMTDGSHSFEEMEIAVNNLLTEYVNATVDLQNFDRAQADAISTQLQLAGVTKESADAYVQAMIERAEAIQQASDAGYDLNSEIDEEIVHFITEEQESVNASRYLAQYALQKQITNNTLIDESSDIEQIYALAQAAGVGAQSLANLVTMKAKLANVEAKISYIEAHPESAKAEGLDKLVAEAEKIQQDVTDYVQKEINKANKNSIGLMSLEFDKSKLSDKNNSGGSSASKEVDEWKEAYEKELAALDHLHEMELISDITYFEELEKLNEKYFADNEKYTEEYTENLEKIYKGFQSAYKSYIDNMSNYWQKSLDAGALSFSEYCSNMESMLNSLRDSGKISDATYYNSLVDYYGNVVSNYDKAINAAQRVIKKRIDELEKEKEALEKSYDLKKDALQAQIDDYEAGIDARNKQIDAINEQIDVLNDEIDSYQKEIDKLEEANKERQAALDMQKALYNLSRAENQRTQMTYKSDLGFVYESNTQDIKNAQDEIENLRHEQAIREIEKTISTLENSIDILEDNIESLEDEIDDLDNNIEELESQIDSLEDELDSLKDKIDEQIDSFEEYSEEIGHCAEAWTEAQEDMVAASVWGANWQDQILSQSKTLVTDFQDTYVAAQQAQADAAIQAAHDEVDAYNDRINAINAYKDALEKASKTSTYSASSSSSNITNGKTSSSTAKTTAKNSSISYQKISSRDPKKQKQIGSRYGSGTENALPGWHEVAEAGDEIILDNHGNAFVAKGHQLHDFEGGEKVFDASETAELLKGKYLPIEDIIPNYSEMLDKITKNSISASLPVTSNIIRGKGGQPMNVSNSVNITIGDIHVTEVDNASQIAKAITNQLPNALLQELKRK